MLCNPGVTLADEFTAMLVAGPPVITMCAPPEMESVAPSSGLRITMGGAPVPGASPHVQLAPTLMPLIPGNCMNQVAGFSFTVTVRKGLVTPELAETPVTEEGNDQLTAMAPG